MAAHNENECGRLVARYLCGKARSSSCFLFATPASMSMSRQGAFEGCAVRALCLCASVRRLAANDGHGHHRTVKTAGTCQLARDKPFATNVFFCR